MNINQKFTKLDDVSQSLLNIFLEPYKEDCKYLKKAQFYYPEASNQTKSSKNNGQVLWFIKGNFSIPDSCYIDDTGHFNSVEFNICYNQLCYILIAYLIENKLLEAMNNWSLEEYKQRQLSDFLIVKFSSSFKKPINSDNFQGTLLVNKISVRGDLIIFKTSCAYYDDNGGWSEGDITIAILNPQKKEAIQGEKKPVLA